MARPYRVTIKGRVFTYTCGSPAQAVKKCLAEFYEENQARKKALGDLPIFVEEA